MDRKDGTNDNVRMEILLRKEREIHARIVAERVQRQKRKEKDDARLFAIIGEALVTYGAQSPDFKTMLRQALAGSVTDERSRKFLTDRRWL